MRKYFLYLIFCLASCGESPSFKANSNDGEETQLASEAGQRGERDRDNEDMGRPSWVEDLENALDRDGNKNLSTMALSNDLVGEPQKRRIASRDTGVGFKPGTRKKSVDIIFVVDGSASMGKFLSNVRHTFSGFIPALSPLDWKAWFINAEHGGSRLFLFPSRDGKPFQLENNGRLMVEQYTLTSRMKNHEQIFYWTLGIDRPVNWQRTHIHRRTKYNTCLLPPGCQGWNEEPLKALKSSFTSSKEHFRKDADVAAVIITDSDEAKGKPDIERVKPAYVLSDFEQAFKGEKELLVYGITVRPGDENCQSQYGRGLTNENAYSVYVSELIKKTKGSGFSLCDKSFVPLARKIVYDFQNQWTRL